MDKSEDKKDGDKRDDSLAGLGISVGAALGLIFGMLLFDNIALGIGLGTALGLFIGGAIKAPKEQRSR